MKSSLGLIHILLLISLPALSLLVSLSYAEAQTTSIETVWGGDGVDDIARSVSVAPDGSVYVAGWTWSFGAGALDALLLKFDSSGEFIWARTWGGSHGDVGNGVSIAPDGSVYVAGFTGSRVAVGNNSGYTLATNALLLKFNSSGDLIWQRTWDKDEQDYGWAVSIAPDGSVYVAGFTGRGYALAGGSTDALLLKFDPSGDLIWQRTWGGGIGGYEECFDIVVSSRSVYVVGDIHKPAESRVMSDVDGSLTTPSGTVGTPSGNVVSPTGTVGSPSGIVGTPSGSPSPAAPVFLIGWSLFTVTFDTSPAVSEIMVDGVTYTPPQLPKSFLWDEGSTHTFSVPSDVISIGEGERLLLQWSDGSTEASRTVTASADMTYTAQFKTQYLLTIDDGGGEVDQGTQWLDKGASIIIRATSPAREVDQKSRLVFTGWKGDVDSTSESIEVTMDGPKRIVASWKTQYYLTIEPGEGEVSESSQWLDEGSSLMVMATTPYKEQAEESRLIFTGWAGDSTSTEQTITLTMDTFKSLTANWRTQYYLKVNSELGEATGEGWYDEGSTATFSVDEIIPIMEGSRAVFTGWSGDSTETSTRASLTMDSPKTVKANWKPQYYLTIDAGQGEVDKSSQWLDGGSVMTITATSPSKVVAEKSRFVFTGWTGDVTSKELRITVSIDSAKLLTANWQQEFYLKVNSELGDPQGEGWYKSGETARFSVTSPLGMLIQDVLDGWSGDAQIKTPEGSMVMDSPKEVTASWRKDYTQLFIIVGVVVATGVVSALALRRKKK